MSQRLSEKFESFSSSHLVEAWAGVGSEVGEGPRGWAEVLLCYS